MEVRFDRNALGQVQKESQRTGDGPWFDVESHYEPGGLRSQRDSSLGHRVRYAYDRAGDLSTVTLGLSEPFSKLPIPAAQRPDWVMHITRAPGSQELARAFPGGVRALWKRDDQGRLKERRVLAGVRKASDPRGGAAGFDVMRTDYAWRSSEQLTSLSNLLTGDRTDYQHDDRGHLIRETRHKRGPQGASWQSQDVPRLSDQVGNLFRQPDFKDAQYGAGGQLYRWGQTSYNYDEHGRLAFKTLADGARWFYRWSPAGRLLEVERPDGKIVAFEYDTFGRRTQKRFDGEVTTYVWDGNDLLHQHKRLADGTLAPLGTWVFEPGTFAPIAKLEGTDRYAVVNDHLGVPQLLTDEKGKVAWRAQLDVYGVPRDEVSAGVDQPLRFPGQLFDAETGLFYNRHRYYDPETGRYVSEDPIGLLGGTRLYGYPQDPALQRDPLGLASFLDVGTMKSLQVAGDGLDNHEILQHAWLKKHVPGFGGRYGKLGGQNPAIALPGGLHDRVSAAQRLAGLHDPDMLKKLTSTQVIEKNLKILGEELLAEGIARKRVVNILLNLNEDSKRFARRVAPCK